MVDNKFQKNIDVSSYQESIKKNALEQYEIAKIARSKGYDPILDVEIVLADNTASRVTGLLSVIFPDIDFEEIKQDILSLEEEYGKNDLRVPMSLAMNIADNKTVNINNVQKRANLAVRAAVAYLTQGVVTAPLEGIADIRIKKNFDGSEYLAIYYAGPIRSAGGTAAAMSVMIADLVRRRLGLDRYKPTEEEVNRYFTEVEDYYTRIAPKQYHPTKEEMDFIITHVPVEITGEPTEKLEVSNYKDLERVETNLIRGGMCLVLLDGLPLKAEKLLKFITKYGKDYGLEEWMWLQEYVELKKRAHGVKVDGENVKYIPSTKYLDKLVGGRPILSFPAQKGGFRLRYGRSFTNGLASVNLSRGVFYLLDFLAMGTQVALEAPGKAAVVMPNEYLENPIVRLKNGSVVEIKDKEDVIKYKDMVDKILFLGDILIPVGEFISNNHVFLPAAYDELWWLQELKGKNIEEYNKYKNWWKDIPDFETAYELSKRYKIGIHPKYNLFWHDITKDEFLILVKGLELGKETKDGLVLEMDSELKHVLEILGVLHDIKDNKIVISKQRWLKKFIFSKYTSYEEIASFYDRFDDTLSYVSHVTGVTIKPRAPTYIGLRMGRPEKAKHRAMKKGSPQLLFPVGEEGGRMRNLMESYEVGKVEGEIKTYKCFDCNKETFYRRCMHCGSLNTKQIYYCNDKKVLDPNECGSKPKPYKKMKISIRELVDKAYEKIGVERLPLVKGVRGVFGPEKDVEIIEKGILRAKYNLYVYKDGTLRYDATDIPLTHFRPKDIGVSVEKLREMGYTHDVYGNPLEKEDQILLLKPQDIIIPDVEESSAADYLLRATKYIDELLEKVYRVKPYYNYKKKEDLVGTLVVGLAPHTSAGIVGRIIGFGKARGILAHPYWHAAKRRNADGDEDSIMLLLDAFLNFSRKFLPETRGASTMDVPLVLTIILNPEEVDDESWNIEVDSEYSLEFYKHTHDYYSLSEMEPYLPKIAENIIREGRPFDFVFNIPHRNLFDAPNISKYIEIPDMLEKVKQQLSIAKMIRAADENKVAEEIIKKHFIKDMKGNLRQFSKQKFRCSKCNTVYRRPPLKGVCEECGGPIILTVSENTIRKYAEVIKYIITNYSVSSYTLQTFQLIEDTIETMFGKKSTQKTLFG